VRSASQTAREWTELLKEAAADFEADRLANKVRTHYDGYRDAPDDDYLLDAFYKPGQNLGVEGDAEPANGEPQSDSAEDEDSDATDADAMDADAVDDADAPSTSKASRAKPTKLAPEKPRDDSDDDVRFDADDDIDALFAKAEKKNKNKLGAWDELPGDGTDLASALKPRKKLKKTSSSKKSTKKR
jgi:hypothetical protein